MANVTVFKRLIKSDRSKILHSSAFAQSQSGSNFGAASSETFAQRQARVGKTKYVRGYHFSEVGRARRATSHTGRQSAAHRSTPKTGLSPKH